MNITDVLKHPIVYQAYQDIGGFHSGRLKAIATYLPMKGGEKVVDIGCGPGFIVNDLPSNISYMGFDTDKRYIAYANAHFGKKGRFHCQIFDEAAAQKYGPVDVVMMNGVLHHLRDNEVRQTLLAIKRALREGGRLFTVDGCFVDGQSSIARFLLENDRGRYVRTLEQYRSLMTEQFEDVELHIEESLSRLPYTFLVMIGHTSNRRPSQPTI